MSEGSVCLRMQAHSADWWCRLQIQRVQDPPTKALVGLGPNLGPSWTTTSIEAKDSQSAPQMDQRINKENRSSDFAVKKNRIQDCSVPQDADPVPLSALFAESVRI